MTLVLIICAGFIIAVFRNYIDKTASKKFKHWEYTRIAKPPNIGQQDIIYHGRQNNILFEEVHDILLKHCPYFISLEPGLKLVFIERLLSFMERKIFIIKDEDAYKEMPVLVSAAAIQLTFGLQDYHLSFYKYIQIYPEAYLGVNSLRILAGNVENNTITVAWNHILQGSKNATDGSHLGIHEMSHALYVQKMVIDSEVEKDFCKNYQCLLSHCYEAHRHETKGLFDFYSGYAESDMQEFWAESCELFFEKPAQMCTHYPELYVAMKTLLNQDPINIENPILKPRLSLWEKIYGILSGNKT